MFQRGFAVVDRAIAVQSMPNAMTMGQIAVVAAGAGLQADYQGEGVGNMAEQPGARRCFKPRASL